MSLAALGSGKVRILILLLFLLLLSLLLPTDLSGPFPGLLYLLAQIGLAVAALALSLFQSGQREEAKGDRVFALLLHLTLFAGSGVLVQALFDSLSLVPIVFFLVFPFTVFARRFALFWVPSLPLGLAGAGRSLFYGQTELLQWAALFLLFSLALGYRMSRDLRNLQVSRSEFERIKSDAREMMERIRHDSPQGSGERIRGEQAATAFALEVEDKFLQDLLKVGCRLFNARTGVLLVPDQPGFFRIRAAVLRGVTLVEDLVPADKGFIHITGERGGTLCVSDAGAARKSLGFYPEETPVGSFLVKVVYDPGWARDVGEDTSLRKVRCVLYFDSEKVEAMSLDGGTAKRLDEFGALVLRTMDLGGILQRLATDLSARDAISRYAKDLTRSLDTKDIAEMALEAILEAVPKCDGAVVLLHEDGLRAVASRGELLEGIGRERILRSEPSQMGLLLRRFRELEAEGGINSSRQAEIHINTPQTKRSPFFRRGENLDKVVSFAAIPCIMGEKKESLMAAVAVVSRRSNAFGAEEMEDLRTIAGMMAPALDNARSHVELELLSRTDGLTGLLNQRTFLVVLDGKINHLKRGTFKSLALIMMDGDRFKNVNDTYGHPVGDQVLVELGRRLKKMIRKNDAVARYGGEEFAIVLDNAGEKEVLDIAEKMRQSIRSEPFKTTAGPIDITASFGFSVLTVSEGITRKELLERADQALYRAKEEGRDRVVSYRNIQDVLTTEGLAVDQGFPSLSEEGKRW